jgi:putative flippase GtrA
MKHFWKFICFCFVGCIALAIDLGFFNIFYKLNLGFIISKVSSAFISLIFNFSVNRKVTFSANKENIKKQVYRWMIVYLFAILVNVFAGKIFLMIIGENVFNANLAVIVALIFSVPVSFLGSLLWVFKKEK